MTTTTRWIATITVNVLDEKGDAYQGTDPLRAALLALDDIRGLDEPVIAVEQRSSEDGFFSEPEVMQQFVVDLETHEVMES